MKKSFKLLPLIAALSSMFGLMLVAPVNAQQNSTNGLRISPVRNDITINPGGSQTLQIYIQNVTSQPITIKGVADDFVASTDETGTPRLLLDDNQYAPSHSLKRFVAPINNVTLAPNTQQIVPVSITVPQDAAGGGYYGAIRFLPTGSNSSKNLSLSASVGSLVLLKVPGFIKDQLSLASIQMHQNYTSTSDGTTGSVFSSNKNISVVVRFQNEGNIQEQPFGKLLLEKGGKTIESIEVNNTDPRGNVLPDSIRKFNVPLSKVSSFGKYTVQGAFGYGTTGQLITAKTTFYIIPVALIVLIILLILAIFVLPRMIRTYRLGLSRSKR